MTNEQQHDWPKRTTEHVWGRWMTKNRTTKYRVCVHPECNAVDEAPVASA